MQLQWLAKLRWGAVVSESVLVLCVHRATVQLPLARLYTILALTAATNAALALHLRARAADQPRRSRVDDQHLLGAVLAFDVLALTTMLAFTGGPLNPFSSLYLVYIALAAVVLQSRGIWAIVGMSAAGYAGLFVQSWASGDFFGPDHARHMRIHLKGMWLAFMVAAVFIGYFVQRVQRALRDREGELARVRALQADHEKLAALATLAAGAAHELSTPLSTIAVVARELATQLDKAGAPATTVDDAALIRTEVARCRSVLDQLVVDAGATVGDAPTPTPVSKLIELARVGLAQAPAIEADVEPALEARMVRVPPRAMALALHSVLENAQDASTAAVQLRARARGDRVLFEIEDRGPGIDAETLSRVGDPFFTTKEPGRGMGLGVFLTRSVVAQLGGELQIDSTPGRGTTVRLSVPGLTGA